MELWPIYSKLKKQQQQEQQQLTGGFADRDETKTAAVLNFHIL